MPEADVPEVRSATEDDIPLVLRFIKELAEYEKLSNEVSATEEILRENLFGERRVAEVALAFVGGEAAGFAVFFYNFSTFLGRPGIYLEDLYVTPEYRGAGVGRTLMVHLARLAKQRGCGRLDWSVLDWNEPALTFYRELGAAPVDGWTVYRLSGVALEQLADGE